MKLKELNIGDCFKLVNAKSKASYQYLGFDKILQKFHYKSASSYHIYYKNSGDAEVEIIDKIKISKRAIDRLI